jgi:hypothetical protein
MRSILLKTLSLSETAWVHGSRTAFQRHEIRQLVRRVIGLTSHQE